MSALEPGLSNVAAPDGRLLAIRDRARRVDPLLIIAATVCVLLGALAVFGPLVAPHSPSETSILQANQGASAEHLLGTDSLGRDLFSRILTGARLSLAGPLLVVTISTVAGTTLAISGVWIRGPFERVSVRAIDVMFAFPSLLFAILAVAVFGEGFIAPVLALSVAYTPFMARVVRSVARRERDMPYVDACLLGGLSSWRICTRHLLPNVAPVILAQATIGFASAIIDLAAISFVGLGVQSPSTDWGLMVADGTTALLNGYPRECISAGVMIIITVVAFNVLGERLSRRTQPQR
jgi:peptide/nickel transport system permease protein